MMDTIRNVVIKAFIVLVLCLLVISGKTSTEASLKLSDIPAMRHLPEKYTSGEIIVISVDVNPFLPHGAKIIEKTPDGWDLVGTNPPLSEQPFRNMYVWKVPEKGEILTDIRYAVQIPKGNKSRKEFTGYIDIEKTTRLNIAGDRHIWSD